MKKLIALVVIFWALVIWGLYAAIACADPTLESAPYPAGMAQPDRFEIFINHAEIPITVGPSFSDDGSVHLEHDFNGAFQMSDIIEVRACNYAGCSGFFVWEPGANVPPAKPDLSISWPMLSPP